MGGRGEGETWEGERRKRGQGETWEEEGKGKMGEWKGEGGGKDHPPSEHNPGGWGEVKNTNMEREEGRGRG